MWHLFPKVMPSVYWYYGSHPLLWHPLGQISSESGVQQGDPLDLLFFALVLQILISNVDVNDECMDLLYQAWYTSYVRQCFVLCSAIEVSDTAWKQAQLCLRFEGLGLHSLTCHAATAFIASLSLSGLANPTIPFLGRQS